MNFKPRNCPVCNAPASPEQIIGRMRSNHHALQQREFSLTDCACGELLYISPAPEESDIRAMYTEARQFDQEGIYRGECVRAAKEFYSGRLRAMLAMMNHPHDKPMRVLEAGAGLSWVCRVAKDLNARNITVAQDISSEVSRECTWVDYYYVGSILERSELDERGPYDVISMTHVIEHLVDPVGMLRRLRELVAPNGLVFITAPYRPAGWKREDGIDKWPDWSYNHTPAHIQYFSQGSMERASQAAGFDLAFWDDTQESGQVFEAWLRPSAPIVSMVNDLVRRRAPELREQFESASPFRYVVIDDFCDSVSAERLLEDFPPFDANNARNEWGEVGRKAVVTDIRRISPFYAEAYRYIGSRDFLGLVSQITGIRDLILDEKMFGGGTHENLEGQELDPHVDFNYIEDRKLHRRLNLLLYLNKEWEQSWGGCLEIHSNPRRPKEDRIQVIEPVFNRAVIFETSERSWHGFERIRLPEGKKHLSRKLLSIYLYTRERPVEEIAPPHGTFYVQRPLPAHIVPGRTLTEEDSGEIASLIRRRDAWIEHYHRKELEESRRFQELTAHLGAVRRALRVPLSGYAVQEGPAKGFWHDGWLSSSFEVGIRLRDASDRIVIHGYIPAEIKDPRTFSFSVNGAQISSHTAGPGAFSVLLSSRFKAGELLRLGISLHSGTDAPGNGAASDSRDRSFVLKEISVLQESADFLAELDSAAGETGTVPVLGGVPEGNARTYWPDGWISSPFSIGIRLQHDLGQILIEGYLPEGSQQAELAVRVNGAVGLRKQVEQGAFELAVRAQLCKGELLKLGITSTLPYSAPNDSRRLAMVLRGIRLLSEQQIARPPMLAVIRNKIRNRG